MRILCRHITEWANALDRAAYYYRRELKEIIAHCSDDQPDRDKIRAHAETAIRAADHELDTLVETRGRLVCGHCGSTELGIVRDSTLVDRYEWALRVIDGQPQETVVDHTEQDKRP